MNMELETAALEAPPPSRLDQFRTLELNADLQPLSYSPLSTKPWWKVMFLLVKGETTGIPRLNVLAVYDDVYVNTPHRRIQLPSVVSHVKYIKPSRRVPFTKFNVFLRDRFTCQYTGEKLPPEELTFDHVVPRSRGGHTNWLNIVTAKKSVNEMKDNRTPKEAGLKLLRAPREPTVFEIKEIGREFPPNYLHESWSDFLYWNSELEQD